MPAKLVTPAAAEVVSLAEAKAHLRLETALDDGYVLDLVKAATQHLEKLCWRGFLLQRWELTFSGFRGEDRLELTPSWMTVSPPSTPQPATMGWSTNRSYRYRPYLELARGHLADAPNVAVTYLDSNAALQTLSSSAYFLMNQGDEERHGQLWLNETGGYSWPDTAARPDAVKVQFSVGWADASKVPASLKHAVKLLVSQMYEFRTPVVTNAVLATVEHSLDALISPHRLTSL